MKRAGILALLLSGCAANPGQDRDSRLRVAAFECDVSPPIGHPLCAGGRAPVESIESPLLAKGVVLADGDSRFVLVAIDWCRIENEAYDHFRERIARAVGTTSSQVALQC